MIPYRYKLTPLQAVVLMWHVTQSEDASNDADRTVEEIVRELDSYNGSISKGLLESALYCCNMEAEKGKFWHPLKQPFKTFVQTLLPADLRFDYYYNVIIQKKL